MRGLGCFWVSHHRMIKSPPHHWYIITFIIMGFSQLYNADNVDMKPKIPTPAKTITIAVLTDISSPFYKTTGYENLAAAELAIDDINKNTSFLPDHLLEMRFNDDGCQQEVGLKALSDSYRKEPKIAAVIGISCSVVCELAGYLCADDQWNLPIVSHSCSSDDLSSSDKFPTFSRLSLSVYKYTDAIIAVCKEFEWDKIGIMVTNINWYVRTAEKMKEAMETSNVYKFRSVHLEKFYQSNDESEVNDENSDTVRLLREQLDRMKKKARIIVIVGYAKDINFVLLNAQRMGLNNGHFAFITQEYIQADLDKQDTELMTAIRGVIDFEPLLNKKSMSYQSFSERVKAVVNKRSYLKTGKDVANVIAAQMYDAVWLYAKAVEAAIKRDIDIYDGKKLVNLMSEIKWTGKSGEIEIDTNGDRLGNVQIMNIQDGQGTFKTVGNWSLHKRRNVSMFKDMNGNHNILWPGDPGSPPVACGRQYELCPTASDKMARITLLTLVCMAFLFGLLVRLYLYNRTNK